MWQLVTSVSNKEQGMTLLLDFLEGIYSRKSCGKPAVHLTARELNTNAGIDVLFSTLGEVLPCITDNEKDSSIVYDDLNLFDWLMIEASPCKTIFVIPICPSQSTATKQ